MIVEKPTHKQVAWQQRALSVAAAQEVPSSHLAQLQAC